MWCRRLALERIGHLNARVPPSQRVFVPHTYADEVLLQRLDFRVGHDRDAILATLAAAHDDLPIVELQVLNPQLQRLGHAQSAAVEPGQFDLEHLSVEEEDRSQRLVLRGRGHVTINGKVRQEILDLRAAKFRRVSLVMEKNVATGPEQILLLSAVAVVQRPQLVADLVEEARFRVHAASAPMQLTHPGFGGLFGPQNRRAGNLRMSWISIDSKKGGVWRAPPKTCGPKPAALFPVG